MKRRDFVRLGLLAGPGAAVRDAVARDKRATVKSTQRGGLNVVEAGVADLQAGMQSGKWTSEQLVSSYLARIRAIDKTGPGLHAVIELNPDALALASALDRERNAKGPRGPLHGVP